MANVETNPGPVDPSSGKLTMQRELFEEVKSVKLNVREKITETSMNNALKAIRSHI